MEKLSLNDLNRNLVEYVISFSSKGDKTLLREIKNKRFFRLIIKEKSKVYKAIKTIENTNEIETDNFTIHSFLHLPEFKKDFIYCTASNGHLYEVNMITFSLQQLTTEHTKHQGYAQHISELKMGSKYMLISSSDDRIVKIWDLFNFRCILDINITHVSYLNRVIEYQNKKVLIVFTYTLFKFFHVYENENGNGILATPLFDIKGHENYIYCSLHFPKVNPNLIITGGYGRFIHFWNIDQKDCIKLDAVEEGIWALIYLKNNKMKLIASGSWGKTIKIWDIELKTLLTSHTAHTGMIYGLINHKNIDKRFMISSGYDNKVKIWKLNESNLNFELIHEEEFPNSVRICYITEIMGELVLLISVTKSKISVFKIKNK